MRVIPHFVVLLLYFFKFVFSQDDIKPEDFGHIFIHNPEKFTVEIRTILNNVVNEYNAFYHYSNRTMSCPPMSCPPIPPMRCPPMSCPQIPIIMDSEMSATDSSSVAVFDMLLRSFGFILSILFITIVNLGLIVFATYQGNKLFKTKINPFHINTIRIDPLIET